MREEEEERVCVVGGRDCMVVTKESKDEVRKRGSADEMRENTREREREREFIIPTSKTNF